MDDWLLPGLRFVHYILLIGLFGIGVFSALAWRLLGLANPLALPRTGLFAAIGVAALVSVALMLASIAMMMGQPMQDLEVTTIGAIIRSTDMGIALLARIALLVAAALALVGGGGSGSAAILLGCALSTLAWTGHAATGEGVVGAVHRLSNIGHLLGVGLWSGAVAGFLLSAARRKTAEDHADLVSAMHRFAPWGFALVAMVVLSGLVNTMMISGLSNLGALPRTL